MEGECGYIFRSFSGCRPSALEERCIFLLENAKAGERMLILVSDSSRVSEWDKRLGHIYPIEPRICTFRSFVRQELEVFFPLAAGHAGVAPNTVRPAFLDREESVNLISRVIEYRREREGVFSSLSSTSEKIASDILNSLELAALAGIRHDEAFERLYSTLRNKNEVRRKIYQDAGDIASAYRRRCLELGVLDAAASVELYCRYLLEDEGYLQHLGKINYFIAENMEEWDEAEVSFALHLLNTAKSCAMGYDPESALGETNSHRRSKFIEDRLFSRCRVMDVPNEAQTDTHLSSVLFNAIMSGKSGMVTAGPSIERHPPAELRSEMLEELGSYVCGIIESGAARPSEITILSTYADVVTEFVLAQILQKRGHCLVNAGASERASDSRLCRALSAFSVLCHPQYGIFPSRDDVKQMAEILFGLDPARASVLSAKTCNTVPRSTLPDSGWEVLAGLFDEKGLQKYIGTIAWIEEYQKAPDEDIGVFLQRSLLEVFLGCMPDRDELQKAKRMIDCASYFCRTVSRFGRNAGRDFTESAWKRLYIGNDKGISKNDAEAVTLTTPALYLKSGRMSKVTVICGLGSGNWSPVRIRELVNPNVLSAAWEQGAVYSAELEECDRTLYLAGMMRAVARNCGEKLIIFESLLDANGYENTGVLPEVFDIISLNVK